MRALLRRIDAEHPVLPCAPPRVQAENPASRMRKHRKQSGRPEVLFASALRADVLMVVRIRGEADYTELADVVGTHLPSVRSAVEHFRTLGVLKTRLDGLRVVVSFDESWFAFAELSALLDALARRHRKYRSFAIASRRNAGGPRSTLPVLETAKLPRKQRTIPVAAERIPFCDSTAARILLACADERPHRIVELMRLGQESGPA